jgi:serine dehydrogenase proteinase
MSEIIQPEVSGESQGDKISDHSQGNKVSDQSQDEKVSDQPQADSPKVLDLFKRTDVIALIRDYNDTQIKKQVTNHIQELVKEYKLPPSHKVILFFDEATISQVHSNKIYQAVSKLNNKSDIFMVLVSSGGRIEPAYLISKTCKRLAKNKFIVCIPRRAKSAATLIALGASEIHMGLLSELGPIDPQFGGFPALGLSSALEKIASLSAKFPDSADMFAKYLAENLNITDLGYVERINESAAQYAERLLNGKIFSDGRTPKSLGDHFTNHYKDHNFVIDVDEATQLLGKDIVKEGTKEYELSNAIYDFLDFLALVIAVIKNKQISYVGSIEDGFEISDKKSEEE